MKVKNTITGRTLEISKQRYDEVYAQRGHLQPMDEEGNTPEAPQENLEDLTVVDLRKMAAEIGAEYQGLVKPDIIASIEETLAAEDEDTEETA
jgi:hypothetical protein